MTFVNPSNYKILHEIDNHLVDEDGYKIKILNEHIYMFDKKSNYSDNFGFQWNNFDKTQIDDKINKLSYLRLKKVTNWEFDKINNQNILEAGSGAGRFTRCILENCNSTLYSLDSSDAVFANYKNNKNFIKKKSNFYLIKASIYNMPFKDNKFDKVICLGVLQHTPNIEQTIKSLIDKAKKGGEIVLDFYPKKGFWTKIHAKYILRPFLKKLSNKNLLKLIKFYAPFFYYFSLFLNKIGLAILTRFMPICDIRTLPKKVDNILDWVILDTFDMFSPKYDQPQKISDVKKIFLKYNAEVTFSGFVNIENVQSAVVRGKKL